MKYHFAISNCKFFSLLVILNLSFAGLHAQVLNDECRFATPIPSSDNFCSADGAFTNVGATADPSFTNTCVSLLWQNGVWFSFVPREPAALIRVFGFGQGGTIRNPKIVIFSKCGDYLQCSPGKTVGNDEMLIDNLTIGQTYYIMIESAPGLEGTFKLCIDDFIPVPSPEADCRDGVVLCDKSPFKVESLTGVGSDRNEIETGNCMDTEFQSAWYKWTCEEAGTLSFTLTPNNHRDRNTISDDLDFAVYELPNGIDDCNGKRLLRCMASGANGTAGATDPLSTWINCNGPTGLMIGDSDVTESPGCQTGNNNFVRALDMEVGKSYVLVVNNYSRSGLGFAIEFGGTGTFLGPKPDFEVNANQAFECDKSVVFTNKSDSQTDPIVSYTWNFGDRAVPDRASGLGPYDVTYQSFGDKIAALTVESSRGCRVTKIIDFYVDPCCKDTSTLALNAIVFDLKCFEIPEGIILAQGQRGAPEYSYSLDNEPYRPNPQYGNLAAGDYSIAVQDIKGCRDTIKVVVNQPPPIIVDAGPDQEIELGDTTLIQINYTPIKNKDTIFWDPNLKLIEDLDYSARPFVTTSYTVTVVDSNGCVGTDVVQVRVIKNLNLHAPNVFTPLNGDNTHDFFNVWVTKGVDYIELLEIYDRWGNLVFRGVDGINFNRNDQNSGWDGTFKEQKVNPGVFVWRAGVRWLDGTFSNYAGDVTVLR